LSQTLKTLTNAPAPCWATLTLLIGLFVEILEFFQKLIIFSHPRKKKKKEGRKIKIPTPHERGGIFFWGTMESSN